MIKPPSIQKDYTLIFSGDPALRLPEDQLERAKALEVARETGRWDELIISGETPTLFHMRHIGRDALGWFLGERAHSSVEGRPLSDAEASSLLFRMAIRKVENLDKLGPYAMRSVKIGSQSVAAAEIVDELSLFSVECIPELAGIVFEKAVNPISPK